MVCVLEVDDRESTIQWSPVVLRTGPLRFPPLQAAFHMGPISAPVGPSWAPVGTQLEMLPRIVQIIIIVVPPAVIEGTSVLKLLWFIL